MNHKTHSSRNQSAMQDLAAHEVEGLGAWRAGSTIAFDELQRVNSSRLFKTILRITKYWEDAEDALQDTFLRAYLALEWVEGRSGVYCWLTRIGINSALMILRRRRSRPEALLISSFEEGDGNFPLEFKDSSANSEQLCDLRQRKDRLLQTLRTLECSLRAPIEAQLAGGHSVKEVADTLNISVAAAKARLNRARVRLIERTSAHSRAMERVPNGDTDTGVHANLKNREQQWTAC